MSRDDKARSLIASVAEKFIAAIEADPTNVWDAGIAGAGLPVRYDGTPYHGVNVILLFFQARSAGFLSNRWMTYNQARKLGGQVRKGQRASGSVFYKNVVRNAGTDDEEVYRIARYYAVFNADQIDGLDESFYVRPSGDSGDDDCAAAKELVMSTGAVIRHEDHRQCGSWNRELDVICMPPRECFTSEADFWATLLHELIHWTGHKSRLARDNTSKHRTEAYAFEELVAEFGSVMLCGRYGFDVVSNSAAYASHWCKMLRADPNRLAKAAAAASSAIEFLDGFLAEEEQINVAA